MNNVNEIMDAINVVRQSIDRLSVVVSVTCALAIVLVLIGLHARRTEL